MRRAAESVPATIAEGRGRSTDRDFAHYISMAIGSVTELEHHLQRAFDGELITGEEHESLTEAAIEVRKDARRTQKTTGLSPHATSGAANTGAATRAAAPRRRGWLLADSGTISVSPASVVNARARIADRMIGSS